MVAKGRSGATTAAARNSGGSAKTPPKHEKTHKAASGSSSSSSPDSSPEKEANEDHPTLNKKPSNIGAALKSGGKSKHALELMDIIGSGSTTYLRRSAIQILMTPVFDYVMGVIILFNMLVMVIEMDKSAAGEDESNASWTKISGWAILAIFVLELILRLFALQCIFWRESWNIVDFFIVVVDAGFSLVGLVVGDAFPISILRIFRLAKLARISKVLRVFPELRVLLASLVGSTRAIFWGMVLLFFILLVWSMVAVLFIHPLASKMDFKDCDACREAYSSVMRSMLTLWQQLVANDDWGSVTMDVILQYPISILFFMPMFLSVSMAIMNLILGVVVNVALSSKDQIDAEDESEKKLLRMERHTHILDLCDQMDTDRDGELTREAIFQKIKEPGEFREIINFLDVTEEDMEIIWTIVDHDKRGYAPYKEFVNRLYSIRSSDTEFMLAYIKYYITLIRHDLLAAIQAFEHNVEDDIDKIENIEQQLMTVETQLVAEAKHQPSPQSQLVAEVKLAAGTWEVIDKEQELSKAPESPRSTSPVSQKSQRSQKSPESPKNSKTKSTGCSSVASQGSLRGRPEDRVYDERAWDKQLRYDMEALQLSLKDILLETSRKLESQVSLVSLMNQKIISKMTIPEAAVEHDALQSDKRVVL